MNFRTTYILFGLLVALFGVVGLVLMLGPSAPKGADALFPSATNAATKIDSDDFTRVVIQRLNPAEEEIVLEKGEGKAWRVVAPRDLPADSASVSSLLREVIKARVDKNTKVPSRKAAGLDSPSRVLLLTAGGRDLKLTLGDTTPLEEAAVVYAESSDRPGELLAVKKSEIRSALDGLAAFRGKDLLGDTGDLAGIKLTMGKKALELKKEKGNWRFVRPDYGEADASGLVTALAGFNVTHTDDKTSDFVKDAVKPEELAKATNDASKGDALRVEVTREKGKPSAAIVWVSKKDGEKFFAAEDTGKLLDVVKVMASNAETLVKALNDPSELRNKTLVSLEGTPDAIDVRNSWGLLEFRKPERAKSWELYRDGKAVKVDDGQVRLLIDALKERNVVKEFPETSKKKELGLEAANAIEVKVYADSLEKPDEKKPGKPAFKKGAEPAAALRFGNEVGANVAVERVLMKDVVMVPSEVLLKQVKAGPLAYFDKSVKEFNTGSAEDNVTRLELARPGEVVEVVREKDGAPWTFAKPAAYKGRKANGTAVNDMLDALNRPKVVEIAAEKADDKELGTKYGLDKPALKATVTVKEGGKEKTHTYDLGNMTGKNQYARVAGNPMIYVFDAAVADSLKKELRDMSVLEFDVDKVASVTMRGWKPKLKKVFEISVARDGGKWTAKDGYDLDERKLADFLRKLSSLKAERIITGGKNFKPEDGGFQVTLTLTDKTQLVLNLGSEEGGTYPATSSQAKGDVFAVAKEDFAGPVTEYGHFGK